MKILSVIFRNRQKERFIMLAEQVVNEEMLYKSSSTVNNYLTALRSFMAFADDKLVFRNIDGQLMEHYQQYLKQRGVCLNTISCYMRSLCTIYNKVAAKKNSLSQSILSTMCSWEKRRHKNARLHTTTYCLYNNCNCLTTPI